MVEIGRGVPRDEREAGPPVVRPESDGPRYPSVEQKPITGDNSATVPQQKTSEVSVPEEHIDGPTGEVKIDINKLPDTPTDLEASIGSIFDANSGGQ